VYCEARCRQVSSILPFYFRDSEYTRNGRAVGVEYINDNQGDTHTVNYANASKLVVVSAGAFGSPTILQRSGIGAKKLLEKHGVHLVVDLPGVGESYQGRIYFVPLFPRGC
jgi:alcohol oxidase